MGKTNVHVSYWYVCVCTVYAATDDRITLLIRPQLPASASVEAASASMTSVGCVTATDEEGEGKIMVDPDSLSSPSPIVAI